MAWKGVVGRLLMAAGVFSLGWLELATGDFVRKWEPVTAGLPGRLPLAWASGLLLMSCGAGLIVRCVAAVPALVLSAFLLSWILVLHTPQIAAHPDALVVWSYPAGVLAVAMGALTQWTAASARDEALRRKVRTAARLAFAPALVVFGLSHLLYAQGMAVLVPAFLPLRVDIVYATGLAHIAAGLALLINRFARLAATLEAAMLTGFVLMVDVPRFAGGLVHGPPWALCFETALAGAGWVIAGSLDEEAEAQASASPAS